MTSAGTDTTLRWRRRLAAAEAALSRMNAFVGCASIKLQVRRMADIALIDDYRRSLGIDPGPRPRMHAVMSGNPGTGKSSTAAILGEVMAAIGFLERSTVITVTRADLVGGFVGHTAPLVNACVDRALGGVLFIDEAYALAPREGVDRDFGHEAISQLLVRLERDGERFLCLAAGYPAEMDRFLDSNPGMRSRFPVRLGFPDYTVEEIGAILRAMAEQRQLTWSPDAVNRLARLANHLVHAPDFANARSARSALDTLLAIQAGRLRSQMATGRFPDAGEVNRIIGADLDHLFDHFHRLDQQSRRRQDPREQIPGSEDTPTVASRGRLAMTPGVVDDSRQCVRPQRHPELPSQPLVGRVRPLAAVTDEPDPISAA